MKMIQAFDPTAAMSGTFDPQTVNACGRIVLFNESAIGLQLSFSDGSNASLPAFYFRSYYVAKPGPVNWTRLYTIATGGTPLAIVIGESYESQEAKGHTFTEGPLNRQTSIGNSIPVGTSSSSIANDGNAAGASVVEATVSGDGSSAVQLSNDGHLTIGNATHHGVVSIDNGNIYSNGAGVLAVVGQILANLMNALPGNDFTINVATGHKIALQVNGVDIVDINGAGLSLLVGALSVASLAASGAVSGNTVTATGAVSGNTVTATGAVSGNTVAATSTVTAGGGFVLSGGDVTMNGHNVNGAGNVTGTGTVQGATVTSIGVMNAGGGFNLNGGDMHLSPHNIADCNNISCTSVSLTNGSFSRISKFTGTGTGNFAHGLGAGPDLILCNPCLLNNSSQTIGFGTRDATNVQVTTGGGFAWEALAIKF